MIQFLLKRVHSSWVTCKNLEKPVHTNNYSLVENIWLASFIIDDWWDLSNLSSLILVITNKFFLEFSALFSFFLFLSGKDLPDNFFERSLLLYFTNVDKFSDSDILEHIFKFKCCMDTLIYNFSRNNSIQSLLETLIFYVLYTCNTVLFHSLINIRFVRFFETKFSSSLPLDLFCNFLREPHHIIKRNLLLLFNDWELVLTKCSS